MGSNDSTAKEQSFLFNVNKIFLVIHPADANYVFIIRCRFDGRSQSD